MNIQEITKSLPSLSILQAAEVNKFVEKAIAEELESIEEKLEFLNDNYEEVCEKLEELELSKESNEVQFAYDWFKEVNSYEDFVSAYADLNRRRIQLMDPIGLDQDVIQAEVQRQKRLAI